MALTADEIAEITEKVRKVIAEDRGERLDLPDKLLTASDIVTERPCRMYAIIAVASNAAYSEWAFRNGETSSDTSKLNVTMPQYQTIPIIFKRPIRFDKGLYVQFVTAGSYCFVQYAEDEH